MSYNREGSKVYTVFIDRTKAYDNVNHQILFVKLSKTNLNLDVVNSLGFMYNNLFVRVSLNGVIGDMWKS